MPSTATPPGTSTGTPAAAERFLAVEGGAGKLRVSDGGSGEPAVVLVHGLGSDLAAWRAQFDHLRAGRRTIAYDQRGHGGSEPARDGVYTIDALAGDLDAVARALGLTRFVLVGHSLSGEVVTAYAGAHPEKVTALVYVDAVADFGAFPREALEAELAKEAGFGRDDWRRAFGEMLGPRARPDTRERVLASLDRTDLRAIGALRRDMIGFSARSRLARWKGPALAIEMEGDVPPIRASEVLGIPRTIVPGASHWLMLDAPAETSAALDAFLAAVGR